MTDPHMINLADVFSFGHIWGECNSKQMELLQQVLNENAAQVACVELPAVPYDLWLWQRFSGSAGHQGLCARTAAWLTAQGYAWSAYPRDLGYGGGWADVATTDQRIMVECGYTQARKVLRGLAAGHQVLVAPYDDTLAYLFAPVKQARLQEIVFNDASPEITALITARISKMLDKNQGSPRGEQP